MLDNVHWLGHACFKITGSKVVYVDPFEISGGETADIILVTHDHYDHLSPDDLKKIQGEKTTVVVPPCGSGMVQGNVRTIRQGETLTIDGVEIKAVPSYNIGKQFHPKEKSYIGYVFKIDDVTYYHAGDTDMIPEMTGLKPDVAFLPVGGTYTMTAEEAARAVKEIQPKVVVPMHWGSIIGSSQDAKRFKSLCECEVQILEKE